MVFLKKIAYIFICLLLARCGVYPAYAHAKVYMSPHPFVTQAEPCMIQIAVGVYLDVKHTKVSIEGDKVFFLLPNDFLLEVRFLTPAKAEEYVNKLTKNPECS